MINSQDPSQHKSYRLEDSKKTIDLKVRPLQSAHNHKTQIVIINDLTSMQKYVK